ncbi:MAG: hypothetical protein ACKO23_12625, partial [Gemmataceae bacterium]
MSVKFISSHPAPGKGNEPDWLGLNRFGPPWEDASLEFSHAMEVRPVTRPNGFTIPLSLPRRQIGDFLHFASR